MQSDNNKFVDIPGFEGFYQISKVGVVRSLDRIETFSFRAVKRKRSGRVLVQSADKDGYCLVALHAPNCRSSKKVHRLVAETFIPNPFNLPQVNHKNGIKSDNRVENLEWCDQSHNMRHAFKHGLIKPADLRGDKNPRYKTGINETGAFAKTCEFCKSQFIAKIKRYRFCGVVCRNKGRIKPIKQ